jgi:hypothetical protein
VNDVNVALTDDFSSKIFVTSSSYTNTISQPAGSTGSIVITFPWSNYSPKPTSGIYNVTVDRVSTLSGISTTTNMVLGTVKVFSNTYTTLNVTYLWTQTSGVVVPVTTGAKSFTLSGASLLLTYDASLPVGSTYQFKLTLTPTSDV